MNWRLSDPAIRQRPIFLVGPTGNRKNTDYGTDCERMPYRAGSIHDHTSYKTECGRAAVYSGKKEYGGKTVSVTEYTMSEIIASVYDKIEKTGNSGRNLVSG